MTNQPAKSALPQTINIFEISRARRPDDVLKDPLGDKNAPVVVARYPSPHVTEIRANAGACLEVFAGKKVVAIHSVGTWDSMVCGQITVTPNPPPALAEVTPITDADGKKEGV